MIDFDTEEIKLGQLIFTRHLFIWNDWFLTMLRASSRSFSCSSWGDSCGVDGCNKKKLNCSRQKVKFLFLNVFAGRDQCWWTHLYRRSWVRKVKYIQKAFRNIYFILHIKLFYSFLYSYTFTQNVLCIPTNHEI